jgi:hypothetical protein
MTHDEGWAAAKTFVAKLSELWPTGSWECAPRCERLGPSSYGPVTSFVAKATGAFTLKFQDMAKMAAIFGTESLDFGHDDGEPSCRWSSVTYESGTPGSFVVIAHVKP